MKPMFASSVRSVDFIFGLVFALSVGISAVMADQFNHKVILVGDKGAALGGAYAGLADDATATWYNPAGLTQLTQLKLNVSAQLVQYQKQKIEIADEKVLPYNSFNFSPSITSMSQKLGKWAYGFSIVTPQNDLFQGTQSLEASYYNTTPNDVCSGDADAKPCSSRLSLSYNELSKINLLGPSLAYTYTENLSIGLTLYGIYTNQIEKTSFGRTLSQFVGGDSTDPAKYYDNVVNRDVTQTGLGFSAILGLHMRLAPGFTLGVTATPGSYVFVNRNESQRVEEFYNTALIVPDSSVRVNTEASLYSLDEPEKHTEVTAPSLTLACAWAPVNRITLVGQMDYHLGSSYTYTGYSPAENASARSGFEASAPQRFTYTVNKESVVNFSGGVDLKITPTYSLTLGGYSDMSQGPYDSRPASWNRRIDWYGVAISLGVFKQYTESRFGFSAAYGDAGITHFRWSTTAAGQPIILTDDAGNLVRDRQIFNAYNLAIFLSSTLKV
jgi:hypothetical protein